MVSMKLIRAMLPSLECLVHQLRPIASNFCGKLIFFNLQKGLGVLYA